MKDIMGRAAIEAYGLSRRCTATNRRGEQCGKSGNPGTEPPLCGNHGANAPQVQRAARRRLLAMVDPALEALMKALDSAPPCPHCGRSDADRDPVTIRAAQIVLDRAGFGPTAELKIDSGSKHSDLKDMGPEALAAEAEQLVRALREPRPVLEGEVVGTSGTSNFPDRDMPEAPATESESNG